jgi:alpha-ketoglutarate-dependent taurine dioxygenase
MKLAVTNLTPRIGAEIKADRETLLAGSEAKEIRRLLEERGVLIFRNYNFADEEQLAFSKTLGEVLPQGQKGIMKITLDKNENAGAEYLKGSFYWHIDGASDDVPTLAALLNARRLSATGGQTEFANTYAAYEDLPETEKKSFEKLRVVHAFENAQRMVNPEPSYAELQMWQRVTPKTHPLVWKHRSGRKSLVLGATASHIEGMSLEEGRALLCRLLEWSTQRKFVYQHQWAMGDLLMWDNTGTMHRVLPYALDSGRLMHRTTLAGEEALA